jgi:hypothetical protein
MQTTITGFHGYRGIMADCALRTASGTHSGHV